MRITKDFNNAWKFQKLPKSTGLSELKIESPDFDDSEWESVTLPHTWNAEDGCSGRTGIVEGGENYYRGLGGYRKSFYFSKEKFSDKEIFIEFKGANTITEFFVNGNFAGIHEGGFSAFRFDITNFVKLDAENIFVVKVNNAPTDYIPPIDVQGDFTKMGGIYRNVKLIATEKIHINLLDYGSSGIFITPKNISERYSDVDLLLKVANDLENENTTTQFATPMDNFGDLLFENRNDRHLIKIRAEILDAENYIVCTEIAETKIAAKSESEIRMKLKIENPILWNGRQNPYVYKMRVSVLGDDTLLDQHTETFGIRNFHIDANEGFFLNGQYLDLRGVNYHQDSFENGWAMTDEQRERDYKMITEMGCTAVRMAHYQHDSYEYDLCDRLGIAVWTEIGIVNKMANEIIADETSDGGENESDNKVELEVSEKFFPNARQQLIELIRQNYNHPSIIVWGISNELFQMSDEIFEIHSALCDLAKSEDGTRLTTYADAQFWGKFMELETDVVGYNRYFGWYKDAGAAEKFGEWIDEYHFKNEHRPICISEYGGGGAISQHKDNVDWETEIDPWGLRHYENYQAEMHEKIWTQFAEGLNSAAEMSPLSLTSVSCETDLLKGPLTRTELQSSEVVLATKFPANSCGCNFKGRKFLWGKFIWCMFDFASDGREEGDTKGQNDKGLVTRKRERKDSFYFYKSVWNDEPMVHITDKRFSPRLAKIPQVKVYSNAQSVELFVNGVSVGVLEKVCDVGNMFESGDSEQKITNPQNRTVFIWKDILLTPETENVVKAVAKFADGNVLEDFTVWIGIR